MYPNFDIRGNLKPYEKIGLSYEDFQKFFVHSFDESEQRQEIFVQYAQFLTDFRQEITPYFVHLINGSFISNKRNPKDLDFVALIDFETYSEKEALIEKKYRLQGAKTYYPLLDAYTVKIYPENHERRWATEFDLVYWNNWFGTTKMNRAKKTFPKGFIEVLFDKY